MSGDRNGPPLPPPYEDLYQSGQQHVFCIYNEAYQRDYLPPVDQFNGGDRPTSLSVAYITLRDLPHPPDYCELPPPYSLEEPSPQEQPSPLEDPPPVEDLPPQQQTTGISILVASSQPSPTSAVLHRRRKRPYCITCTMINFIIFPPLGIIPLIYSLLGGSDNKVSNMNAWIGFLNFWVVIPLYILLPIIFVD